MKLKVSKREAAVLRELAAQEIKRLQPAKGDHLRYLICLSLENEICTKLEERKHE